MKAKSIFLLAIFVLGSLAFMPASISDSVTGGAVMNTNTLMIDSFVYQVDYNDPTGFFERNRQALQTKFRNGERPSQMIVNFYGKDTSNNDFHYGDAHAFLYPTDIVSGIPKINAKPIEHCFNGIQDGGEKGVDCGSPYSYQGSLLFDGTEPVSEFTGTDGCGAKRDDPFNRYTPNYCAGHSCSNHYECANGFCKDYKCFLGDKSDISCYRDQGCPYSHSSGYHDMFVNGNCIDGLCYFYNDMSYSGLTVWDPNSDTVGVEWIYRKKEMCSNSGGCSLFIYISPGVVAVAGDVIRISIVKEGEDLPRWFDIYLPDISINGATLYVAKDGSTYNNPTLTDIAQESPTYVAPVTPDPEPECDLSSRIYTTPSQSFFPDSEQYCDNCDHCSDSVQNCDETDLNCGGELCDACSDQPVTCTDSDGGKDYYNFGELTSNSGTVPDSCSGQYVLEQYCVGNAPASARYECPNGCSGGKCTGTPPAECIDSDSGDNPNVKGTLTGYNYDRLNQQVILEDFCMDRTTEEIVSECSGTKCELGERICEPEAINPGDYYTFYYACPDGCQAGACIGTPAEVVSDTSEDTNLGEACYYHGECYPNACIDGFCVGPAVYCFDYELDGTETDFNCGGECATLEGLTCDLGSDCQVNSDCESDYCSDNNICTEGIVDQIMGGDSVGPDKNTIPAQNEEDTDTRAEPSFKEGAGLKITPTPIECTLDTSADGRSSVGSMSNNFDIENTRDSDIVIYGESLSFLAGIPTLDCTGFFADKPECISFDPADGNPKVSVWLSQSPVYSVDAGQESSYTLEMGYSYPYTAIGCSIESKPTGNPIGTANYEGTYSIINTEGAVDVPFIIKVIGVEGEYVSADSATEPDLILQDITVSFEGEEFVVNVDIYNNGGTLAEYVSWSITYSGSAGEGDYFNTRESIGPRVTSSEVVSGIPMPQNGVITITATADPYNQITESDETNNVFTKTFECIEAGGAPACFESTAGDHVICSDSDGGIEYYVYGEVTDFTAPNPYQDHCVDNKLIEMQCYQNEHKSAPEKTCPNGCSNGACICDETNAVQTDDCPNGYTCADGVCESETPQADVCADTDDPNKAYLHFGNAGTFGYNLLVAGTTSSLLVAGTNSDSCNGNYIKEYYCKADGTAGYEEDLYCVTGCSEGACNCDESNSDYACPEEYTCQEGKCVSGEQQVQGTCTGIPSETNFCADGSCDGAGNCVSNIPLLYHTIDTCQSEAGTCPTNWMCYNVTYDSIGYACVSVAPGSGQCGCSDCEFDGTICSGACSSGTCVSLGMVDQQLAGICACIIPMEDSDANFVADELETQGDPCTTEGEKVCLSYLAYKECVGGAWSSAINCESGATCQNGDCVQQQTGACTDRDSTISRTGQFFIEDVDDFCSSDSDLTECVNGALEHYDCPSDLCMTTAKANALEAAYAQLGVGVDIPEGVCECVAPYGFVSSDCPDGWRCNKLRGNTCQNCTGGDCLCFDAKLQDALDIGLDAEVSAVDMCPLGWSCNIIYGPNDIPELNVSDAVKQFVTAVGLCTEGVPQNACRDGTSEGQYNRHGYYCPTAGADVIVDPNHAATIDLDGDAYPICPYGGVGTPKSPLSSELVCSYAFCGGEPASQFPFNIVLFDQEFESRFDLGPTAGMIRWIDYPYSSVDERGIRLGSTGCYCDAGYEPSTISGDLACVASTGCTDLDAVSGSQYQYFLQGPGDQCMDQTRLDEKVCTGGRLISSQYTCPDSCISSAAADQFERRFLLATGTQIDIPEEVCQCRPIMIQNRLSFSSNECPPDARCSIFRGWTCQDCTGGDCYCYQLAPMQNMQMDAEDWCPADYACVLDDNLFLNQLVNRELPPEIVQNVQAVGRCVKESVQSYSPKAVLTYTRSGRTVSFDASQSYDPNGQIVRYEWYFDDHTKVPWGKVKLRGVNVACVNTYSSSEYCDLSPSHINPTNAVIEGPIDLNTLNNPCICTNSAEYQAKPYIYQSGVTSTSQSSAVYTYPSETACRDFGKTDKECKVVLKVIDDGGNVDIATVAVYLLNDRDECEDKGWHWYGGSCHSMSEDERDCHAMNWYWYSNRCYEEPPTSIHIKRYVTEEIITQQFPSSSMNMQYTPPYRGDLPSVSGIRSERDNTLIWVIVAIAISAGVGVLIFLFRDKLGDFFKGLGGGGEEDLEESFSSPSKPPSTVQVNNKASELSRLAARHNIESSSEANVQKYIQSGKSRGFKDAQIKEQLIKAGWKRDQIAKFF